MFINIGIDIGAESTKAVMLADGKELLGEEILNKGIDSSGAREIFFNLVRKCNLSRSDISQIVTTGIGRNLFPEADRSLNEITCLAKGINFLVPSARTILEMGGEDVKAVRIDGGGNVRQYFLNDQCAMGTGSALDIMSLFLKIPVEEFGEMDKKSTSPLRMRRKCPVFARTEVVRLISRGAKKEDIIAGLHIEIAQKACGLIYRCGAEKDIVIAGGGAQNEGVVRAVSKELRQDIIVAPHPQTVCALGAAIYGYEEFK